MSGNAPAIDTQVHLIDPQRFPFPEPPVGYVPNSDEVGTLASLTQTLNLHGVEQAVLVSASVYGSDNRILIEAIDRHPDRFRTIVTATTKRELRDIAEISGVVGARLNLVDGKTNPNGDAGLAEQIVDADLILQLQAAPAMTHQLLDTMERPDAEVILDHFGRADLAKDTGDFDNLLALSQRPNTYLKASATFRLNHSPIPGVSDEQGQRQLIEAFGRERILWGSDWPFINFAGPKPTYEATLNTLTSLTGADWQTAADANARRLFGWPL
ncbi:MAG: amidohydrolase family protein [Rhizobiales bacterium]|nr:amidohydrolase family protein [Hyphomicrobiales bacterium]MBO6699935.1 amidohydrolase family protein [Hyphomicrobiales bacterium]MBO6737899.1 amidohydrolase family protein [Hyphomicrobiales bacterium]MBO6913043.1 amidohydrolase family protein [Hyphomicrobiales bacterium]MBO6956632.1 amidohydrolase family protein [Hyphomicrobiales bacterium]